MPAIEVRDLTIAYGGTTAVDGLSFEARAGLVTALLGPNGAGKTSTVEALEGYRRPSSGTVRVLGLDPVAGRETEALQVRRHAPHLVGHLAPGVVANLAATHRLRQRDALGRGLLPGPALAAGP